MPDNYLEKSFKICYNDKKKVKFMTANKFLVIKWDWIEEGLTDDELNTLYGLINKVTENKPEYSYYVVNTDETYADKVWKLIKNETEGISKDDLLKELRELKSLGDVEEAHVEADELVLKYINDKEIEEAYEGVPKWYS